MIMSSGEVKERKASTKKFERKGFGIINEELEEFKDCSYLCIILFLCEDCMC